MGIFSLSSFIIVVIVSLVQTQVSGGHGGEFQYHGKRANLRELTSASTTAAQPPIEASTCPNSSTIAPCKCSISFYGVDIECTGGAVNQASIENVFREIRQVNKIPADRGFGIYSFYLSETGLTQLDLAPFYGSQIKFCYFMYNDLLTKLVTSDLPGDYGSIQVNGLIFKSSPLNREGFGDTLKYFSNQMVGFVAQNVPLNYQSNSDEGEGEILPGLSALTNLTELDISSCNITGRLSSSSWNVKGLKTLKFLSLSDNSIDEIGENVFDFGVDVNQDVFRDIYLQNNKLNESSFHPNSGITRPGHKTYLNLGVNQFTTLPALIFEPYFDAHPQNVIRLTGNPLICDERVSWLKSRRDELQSRVFYARCSNDEGHDVFDSDLIP